MIEIVSPATGETVARVARGTREDVGRAVSAARAAQPAFARRTAFDRAALCHARGQGIDPPGYLQRGASRIALGQDRP